MLVSLDHMASKIKSHLTTIRTSDTTAPGRTARLYGAGSNRQRKPTLSPPMERGGEGAAQSQRDPRGQPLGWRDKGGGNVTRPRLVTKQQELEPPKRHNCCRGPHPGRRGCQRNSQPSPCLCPMHLPLTPPKPAQGSLGHAACRPCRPRAEQGTGRNRREAPRPEPHSLSTEDCECPSGHQLPLP